MGRPTGVTPGHPILPRIGDRTRDRRASRSRLDVSTTASDPRFATRKPSAFEATRRGSEGTMFAARRCRVIVALGPGDRPREMGVPPRRSSDVTYGDFASGASPRGWTSRRPPTRRATRRIFSQRAVAALRPRCAQRNRSARDSGATASGFQGGPQYSTVRAAGVRDVTAVA